MIPTPQTNRVRSQTIPARAAPRRIGSGDGASPSEHRTLQRLYPVYGARAWSLRATYYRTPKDAFDGGEDGGAGVVSRYG